MAAPLLTLQNVHLTFGGTPLLEGAELLIHEGERIALVGRNGSGKSTLLKIAAGLVEADKGKPVMQSGTTIRYLPQEPDFSGFDTTLAYVEEGLTDGDYAYRAAYLLSELGLTGEENPANLSGGEGRRVALAKVLAPEPDILFLDEPTNHLDLPTIEWLERELASLRSAFVLISHDRAFLQRLTTSTVWIDRGRTRRINEGFASFEAWRDKTYEEEDQAAHKLDRKIVREEHWLTYGVTARRKRNVRRLQGLHDLRDTRRNLRRRTGSVDMQASEAEASGKRVIEAKNVAKAYDGRTIVRDMTIRVNRGDRIGIVGPNGAGKTTLVNLLTGQLAPDSGDIKFGANIEMLTLDQKREQLDPNMSLKDVLTAGGGDRVMVGDQPRHVIGYMKDFLFSPEQARTAVGKLSGGERARAMLARSLAKPSNLLVLDEPTNDLDLDTLDLLQELIADYSGTVILVSHDRDFIDRTVTSVLVSDGDGEWQDYAGGYSDMLTQRGSKPGSRLGTDKSPKAKAVKSTAPSKKKGKLNFKQQHALKTLPGDIDTLTASIAKIENEMATPNLFSKKPDRFAELAKKLGVAQTSLSDKEEQWLELEMLREELNL
ncbi:MAG: ATP-binding cassette domain-containing protein [Rhizobiales bacterium]|nr:ATP-binding cassette domain-containing protein [Hyphomicrobiales bacterium]